MTDAAKQEEINYLNMSDEELMNAPPPSAVAPVEEEDNDGAAGEQPETVEGAAEGAVTEQDTDDGEEDGEDEGANPAQAVAEQATQAEAGERPNAEQNQQKVEPQAQPDAAVNYEAEYKKLLAPFKANGREIAVKSVDDAITLMQMGANYNKKMAALKPNLRLMKMLENNGLLDEAKISFLIDLEKKNPQAISKLISESGLDPMDLDADKASAYKQSAYTVDDREIELDTVLDELQGTPAYNRTLEIVGTKWDSASKQVIAQHPNLLKVLNDHVERGIYDLITKEIESERVFGRLNGLSDLEAYRQVGDAIQARGGFNHLGSKNQGQPSTTNTVTPAPKPSKVNEDKLRDKRRAASSTKPAVTGGGLSKDFNPLALSDDEFSKLVVKQYL